MAAEPTSANTKLSPAELHQFNELQIRYRLLDNDRKGYAEKVTNQIRKQHAQISRLKAERDKLEGQVADESAPLMATKAANTTTNLMHSLHSEEQCAAKHLRQLENQSSELDKQIKVLRTKVSEERRRLARLYTSKKTPEDVERQVRLLENRLNKATVRYNEAVATNKQLREHIDGLRRERTVYDSAFQKLDRKLSKLKESLRQMVDESNLEYDERDSLQSVLSNLEKIELDEAKAFDAEWNDLSRQLEKDQHLRELLNSSPVESPSPKHQATTFKERLLKAREDGSSGDKKDKILSYEEMFSKMKSATGINDISVLVKTFVDAEVLCFSLFNYSNELGIALDKLQIEVASLREALTKVSVEETNVDNQRRQMIDQLEQQTKDMIAKTNERDLAINQGLDLLDNLKKVMERAIEQLDVAVTDNDEEVLKKWELLNRGL
ncbi:hypothetical protein GEMRC1_002286 [Eukaryota sp. GEM-RC1]